MGGSVFADADGVVRQNIGHLLLHEGGKPHGVFHVIGENKESRAVNSQSAVKAHAVADRRHGVFADTEVEIGTRSVFGGIIRFVFHERFVGRREVRASSHEVGNKVGKLV